jgi:beta-carotene hydroxylase
MLRHRSDLKTLAYLAATLGLFVYQWTRPGLFNPWLYPLSLLLSLTAAVISHNHNHVALWRWRPLNLLTSYVIGFFYGFPAFAWVPTHNQNHHRFNNSPGDLSISPVLFRRNHLLALAVYPPVTEVAQVALLWRYMRTLRGRRLWGALSEYAVFGGLVALCFVVDVHKAVALVVLPQVFAKYGIQCIGYFQHIGCEPASKWDHSRNFVGQPVNALLFNNGFHTVHHHHPGVHWSELPALHAAFAKCIDASLQQKSLPAWFARVFVLDPGRAWFRRTAHAFAR